MSDARGPAPAETPWGRYYSGLLVQVVQRADGWHYRAEDLPWSARGLACAAWAFEAGRLLVEEN